MAPIPVPRLQTVTRRQGTRFPILQMETGGLEHTRPIHHRGLVWGRAGPESREPQAGGVSTTSRTPHLPARTSMRAGHDSRKRLRVTHRKAAQPAWVQRGGLSVTETTTFYFIDGPPREPPAPTVG